MKSLLLLLVGLLYPGFFVLPAQAAISSVYAYGDSVSTTTSNTFTGSLYYGNRECNGRVWVEVLSQRLGLAYQASNNLSYYGHYSTNLLSEVGQLNAPTDASNALFILWIINADLVDNLSNFPLDNSGLSQWTNALNASLTNHLFTLTNLYNKGFRSFVVPNAVDITAIPLYSGTDPTEKAFVRQRIVNFNSQLAGLLNSLKGTLPGVAFYSPDYFALLDNVQSNAASYGLTNATVIGTFGPQTADAITYAPSAATNGIGTNWLFWDNQSPSAKAHVVIADIAFQLISPTTIGKVSVFSDSNQLDVINLPLGLRGFVDGGTNLPSTAGWTLSLTNFSSLTSTQAVFVPASTNLAQFYRLRFPNSWSWP